MQEYEVMVLYKPLLLEDIKNNTVSKIKDFIKKNKGEIKEKDNLGKRLLAYPIKKFQEGHYIEYALNLSPSKIEEFKRELRLMDNILRFLIIAK